MASNGNKGKFSERIKKIAFRKRNRMIEEDENNKIQYQNVLKVLAAIPGMVYSNMYIDEQKKSTKTVDNNQTDKDNGIYLITNIDVNKIKEKQDIYFNAKKKLYSVNKLQNVNGVSSNVDAIKIDKNKVNENIEKENIKELENTYKINVKEKEITGVDGSNKQTKENESLESVGAVDNEEIVNNLVDDAENIKVEEVKHDEKVEKLEKDILDIIKKKLILSINNLELLQTDLYILSEINENAKTQEECEKQIEEIKELLKEIEKLKEQYDFLKDNYDFEYLTALDDDNLIDKIIELKDIFDNNEMRAFVEDYKLLDEYKYLYLKFDKIQEETNDLEKEKEKELEELKERDIDFDKLTDKVYNMANFDYIYGNLFNEQRDIMMEMEGKISKIDSYEEVNYHLEGVNKLILNSFKYLGLLMLNPLRGVFPSISLHTMMTRDAIKGIYHGLEWKEDRKTIYTATDYSSVLNNTLDTMNRVGNYLDENLNELIKLKNIYNEKFKEYENDIDEYKEVIKKINDMENIMLSNKIKVEMLKKKALQRGKDNHKKLVLVHELNQQQEK